MEKIGSPENLELYKTIVLNGIIGDCRTGDETEWTIGVKVIQKAKRFNGQVVETIIEGFPFTQEMADKCRWKDSFASIQMLTSNKPIDPEHIDEAKVVSMMGEVESEYYCHYSEYTGYLYTKEAFKCGGHDIPKILESHIGEYIHMEIELYKKIQEGS